MFDFVKKQMNKRHLDYIIDTLNDFKDTLYSRNNNTITYLFTEHFPERYEPKTPARYVSSDGLLIAMYINKIRENKSYNHDSIKQFLKDCNFIYKIIKQ